MKKKLFSGTIIWALLWMIPFLLPLYSAQTPVVRHYNDSTGRGYLAPLSADSADTWTTLDSTRDSLQAVDSLVELNRDAVDVLEALELTDSAKIAFLEALELTDSTKIAFLEALELTDSLRIKTATDTANLAAGRTQGLSETGGVMKLLNDFTIVSNSNKDTTSVETDIKYNSGLSFDLDKYRRNVTPFICYTGAYTWSAYNSGVTTADAVTYLTDGSSVKITIASSGAFQGASIDITDWDAETFSDNSASTTADYIRISVNIGTADIADLGSSKLELLLLSTNASPDTTDGYRYELSTPSNGWNHYKIAKSAFTEIGTGDWGDITWVLVRNNLTATSAEVIFYVDVGQMVRKAVSGAWPNPFQRELDNNRWQDEWLPQSPYAWAIVKESGVLAAMSLTTTANTEKLISAKTYGDISMSGMVRLGGGGGYFGGSWTGVRSFRMTGDVLYGTDSAGATVQTAFVTGNTDPVYHKLDRKGTSITASVSLTGLPGSWTSLTTTTYTAPWQILLRAMSDDERLYSFGASSVAYADKAGVADRLSGIGGSNSLLDSTDVLYVNVTDTMQLAAGTDITVTNDGARLYTIASTAAGGGSSTKESTLVIATDGTGDVGYSRYHFADSLELALDMCRDSSVAWGHGRARLTLKAGAYYLNSTVDIDDAGSFIFDGYGASLITTGAGLYSFTCAKSGSRLDFRGLEVIGTGGAYGFIAVNQEDVDSVLVKDCIVSGFSNSSATVFNADTASTGWRVEDCVFKGNYTVKLDASFSSIKNCQHLAPINNGFEISCHGSTISDCSVDCPPNYGIYLNKVHSLAGETSSGWRISGNSITYIDTSTTYYGIYTHDDADGGEVNNNFIGIKSAGTGGVISKGGPGYGIYLGGNKSMVSNNKIFGYVKEGIHMLGIRSLVSGNHISAGAAAGTGIYVEGSVTGVVGNYLNWCAVGIYIKSTSTKSGYSENWFRAVSTNIDDNGTTTVAGDIRDLD